MDTSEYDVMYAVEDRLWWYAGMRNITKAILDHYVGVRPRDVLDAGCGTGANLIFLQRYGQGTGVDIELHAIELSGRRGLNRLVQASVCELPVAGDSFDLVTSFDVIYHLDVASDDAALAEFYRVLRPGGFLFLRVPAYDWLRGRHDVKVHTRSRYTTSQVRRKVQTAGFSLLKLSHANCLLFPIALAKRMAEGFLPDSDASDVGEPRPGNSVLAAILGAEGPWLQRLPLPFGLSIICLARKPE